MMANSNAAFMPHLSYQYPPQPTYSQYQEQQQQQQQQQQPQYYHQMQSSQSHHSPSWQTIPRGANMPSYGSNNTSASPNPSAQATSLKSNGTGKKRKRLQRACVACHKAKRRCDGGLPCSNCDFSGRTCAYSDSQGKAVPPTKRTLRPSEAAFQEQKMMNQQDTASSSQISSASIPNSPSAFPNTPERWTEQLDLAWSAIHTFADATSTMMQSGGRGGKNENESTTLPLTVAHNLAVILERMNEQHALLTEHMTAMGVAMLKKSCSTAYQSSTSHQDHHAWSDLERRSERLQSSMRMDNERLQETQSWILKGNMESNRGAGNVSSQNRPSNPTVAHRPPPFDRTSWSASPPMIPIRSSLSPIQPSNSLFSSNNSVNGGNNYGQSTTMPKLKSRHNSTSSTTSGSSVMTIGNNNAPQTYSQLQESSSAPSSTTNVPFLPPLTGLSSMKKADSQSHPILPPLRRYPSPPESNKRSIFVEY